MAIPVNHLFTDRLAEFRQLAISQGSLQPQGNPALSTVSERTGRARLLQSRASALPPQPVASTDFMRDFFDSIKEIQGILQQGRDGVHTMESMLEEALQATTKERQSVVSDRLTQLVEETNRYVTNAKLALEALKAKSDAEAEQKPNSAECRIRTNMQQAMAKKHQQLLLDFQKAQMDLKKTLERQQAREMQLLCPEASEEEVQQMIEDGHTSSQMLVRKMAGAHAMVLDEVRLICDKHQDILRLERSMQDLAQMFQEMAVLVDAQGELLDAIEVHVHNTNEYTGKAVKELVITKKTQANTRKWMCCLMVFLMIVLVIIVFPFVFNNRGN